MQKWITFSKMCKTYMNILAVINPNITKPPTSQDIDPCQPPQTQPCCLSLRITASFSSLATGLNSILIIILSRFIISPPISIGLKKYSLSRFELYKWNHNVCFLCFSFFFLNMYNFFLPFIIIFNHSLLFSICFGSDLLCFCTIRGLPRITTLILIKH